MKTRKLRGFTLIELMCVLAVAAIVSSLAYPSFRGAIQKARRSEALVALLNVQMTQERYRADRAAYGSLADIGIAAATSSGRYTLAVTAASASGFEVMASAAGPQSADASCRHLRLSVDGMQVAYASGPDTSVANSEPVNRACWGV